MQNNSPYYLLVFVCMGLMLFNALKKDKQLVHYLFALFCGSLCMVGAQKLSASSVGGYQYLIGLFTCATCNVSWLIARALFRENKPISRRHIVFAATIAGLIMFNQTWHYLVSFDPQPLPTSDIMWRLKQGVNEVTILLSSSILVLSFWEAIRGYSEKTVSQKMQSVLFASAWFLAVFNASVLPKLMFSKTEIELYNPIIITSSALLIVLAMQTLMFLQARDKNSQGIKNEGDTVSIFNDIEITENTNQHEQIDVAPELIDGIDQLINKQQLFLQTNLKISDFAQVLQVSEYKISRAIRYHYKVANFNLFINQYRVKYAQVLLASEDAKGWSILSIALESGFSSLATFNRVFKSIVGEIPNEYRKQSSNHPNIRGRELVD
ncbi:helix-turn-helix domain-containing protein [Pseudoalteromonas rhizosphaerae]|uniref:helix-turn-helix domain-containing protein n=1 Tax=Pseudoalteromonas rhizosphaerae TaxID=2518973 RepID=UPI001FE6C5B0|nr:AraC family transcriptional regulator [Pseudoalteromonas rhizosphaerae]